ncbi:NADPH-dependent 7-cyano-7-deazaguanine reductase QueF [bacterium]|nr:NADPH-dependent 7-cyano-7-deazaguanine reductase QueF [bacterium]
MATAEGLRLPFESEDAIRVDFLEVFPYIGERQFITYETKEWSCVCPFSGLPDYGILRIEYIPDELCVELKSLKYYIVSYRSVGIYQEPATNRLFQDLYPLVKPTYLKITTQYNTRGGIDTTCVVEKGSRSVGDR